MRRGNETSEREDTELIHKHYFIIKSNQHTSLRMLEQDKKSYTISCPLGFLEKVNSHLERCNIEYLATWKRGSTLPHKICFCSCFLYFATNPNNTRRKRESVSGLPGMQNAHASLLKKGKMQLFTEPRLLSSSRTETWYTGSQPDTNCDPKTNANRGLRFA